MRVSHTRHIHPPCAKKQKTLLGRQPRLVALGAVQHDLRHDRKDAGGLYAQHAARGRRRGRRVGEEGTMLF